MVRRFGNVTKIYANQSDLHIFLSLKSKFLFSIFCRFAGSVLFLLGGRLFTSSQKALLLKNMLDFFTKLRYTCYRIVKQLLKSVKQE